MSQRFPTPIDILYKALNQQIIVRVKRNQSFEGILKSVDTHMNIWLEKVTYTYFQGEEEVNTDGEGEAKPETPSTGKGIVYKEVKENYDTIVVRGDNILFVEFPKV